MQLGSPPIGFYINAEISVGYWTLSLSALSANIRRIIQIQNKFSHPLLSFASPRHSLLFRCCRLSDEPVYIHNSWGRNLLLHNGLRIFFNYTLDWPLSLWAIRNRLWCVFQRDRRRHPRCILQMRRRNCHRFLIRYFLFHTVSAASWNRSSSLTRPQTTNWRIWT